MRKNACLISGLALLTLAACRQAEPSHPAPATPEPPAALAPPKSAVARVDLPSALTPAQAEPLSVASTPLQVGDADEAANFIDQLARRQRLERELVLVLLAKSTCEPCGPEVLRATTLAAGLPDRLQVVTMTTDPQNGRDAWEPFKTRWQVQHPLLPYDARLLAGLERLIGPVEALPASVLLDRRTGKVLWRGPGTPNRTDLAQIITL